MYTSATATNGSVGNRDSVSRDQLLHARRRRRIKSMTSAPVTDTPLSGIIRSPSDLGNPSNEEQKALNTVPRQIRANHRTRSLSLNGDSSIASLFSVSPELPASATSSTGSSPSSSGELIPPDQNNTELPEALASKMKLVPEGTLVEKTETIHVQVEIHQHGRGDEETLLPRILQRLNESTNRSHPIPLLSRRDRKRNLRSYSLPPKIPQPEQIQAQTADAPQDPSQNTTATVPDEDGLHSPLSTHSLPQYHTLPKYFNLKEASATHMTVWTESDTISCERRNGKKSTPKSARKRKENSTDTAGDWKLDIEEDEIRNLPIDTSVIELHQRCLAPDPISMLVGDYPLDRTTKTLKFSSTISTSTMIIKPSTTMTPSTITNSQATIPNPSKLHEAPQASPLRFVSFSRLPPAGLPSIPGISLIPLLQIPDNLAGFPINSPRTPPDRSKYNVNIISPRSAFSPHTPHSSPR